MKEAAGSRLVRACLRQPVDCTPVWFMRQAGAYIPEHRRLLDEHGILGLTRTPELCARVTMLPVERLGVDAAVMYADIIIPLGGMGVDFHYEEGVGPIIHEPIRSVDAVAALQPLAPEASVGFILDTVRQVRRTLPADVALIGFSGAPFTLAAYLVEGRPSRTFPRTKAFMYSQPKAWDALLGRLAEAVQIYLEAQAAAGIDVIKLFDSWVGVLRPDDYRRRVFGHTQRVLEGLSATGLPRIHFGTDTAALLPELRGLAVEVHGLDWRIPLNQARSLLGDRVALQGNLDPAVMLGPFDEVSRQLDDILAEAGPGPGHIFSLGHRVEYGTSVESLSRLVTEVHRRTRRDGPAGLTGSRD